MTKRNQEQTNAFALCFFLNGRMLHPYPLKKAFTLSGSAFVRGLRASIFFLSRLVMPPIRLALRRAQCPNYVLRCKKTVAMKYSATRSILPFVISFTILVLQNYYNNCGFHFIFLDKEKVTKRNQEQRNAFALCFFLNGRMLHPSSLKKAFTRSGSAFVRGLRALIFFLSRMVMLSIRLALRRAQCPNYVLRCKKPNAELRRSAVFLMSTAIRVKSIYRTLNIHP